MNQIQLNQLKALVDTIKPEEIAPVAPKITPYIYSPTILTRLVNNKGSWRITRTATKVKFGCGLVTVNKSDLQTMADFKELEPKFIALKKQFDKISAKKTVATARLVAAWRKSHNEAVTQAVVEKIPTEVLKGLIG